MASKKERTLDWLPVVGMEVHINGNPFDEQLGQEADNKQVHTITEVKKVDYAGTSGFWLKTNIQKFDYIDALWFRPV